MREIGAKKRIYAMDEWIPHYSKISSFLIEANNFSIDILSICCVFLKCDIDCFP